MNQQLNSDLQQLDTLFDAVKTQALDYLRHLDARPTSTSHAVHYDDALALDGAGSLAALAEFNRRFEPLMVAASGPRYWGFVTGGTTPAAIVGDWLTSVYDQNTQSSVGDGDISANIEFETIQLLLDLLALPKDFFGGFVTGAMMSNFTGLAVARQWLGQQYGKDFAKEGVSESLSVLSATPHSSSIKALSLLGIGSNHLRKIKTMEGNREAIDLADLEREILCLNGAPFILISSAGTVNTVDFDDFAGIAQLKQKYTFWWHIDAAFGGFAQCSRDHRHLLHGWEGADSITVDCHKWLNVPYESAVFFIKEKHGIAQVETFQNSNAPYLGDPKTCFNYLNMLPENSRRLKALPAWFTLKAYGKSGMQDIVENNIRLAHQLGTFIEQSEAFCLLAPVRLNTVCFGLKGVSDSAVVAKFLQKLNATGKVFMTPTNYQGTPGMRAALVNWRTCDEDVELVTQLMLAVLRGEDGTQEEGGREWA